VTGAPSGTYDGPVHVLSPPALPILVAQFWESANTQHARFYGRIGPQARPKVGLSMALLDPGYSSSMIVVWMTVIMASAFATDGR
jgi:hypothetical protein